VASRQDRKPHKDIANATRLYFGRPENQARIRGRRTGRFEIRHCAVPDKETGPCSGHNDDAERSRSVVLGRRPRLVMPVDLSRGNPDC